MTATRKSRRPVKARKTHRKSSLLLNQTNADIYVDGILKKDAWVRIRDNRVQIYRGKTGRATYLILRHYDEDWQRPIITFNDAKLSFQLGGINAILHDSADYKRAKSMLEPYSRRSH
jgi:hypothetical protein